MVVLAECSPCFVLVGESKLASSKSVSRIQAAITSFLDLADVFDL